MDTLKMITISNVLKQKKIDHIITMVATEKTDIYLIHLYIHRYSN